MIRVTLDVNIRFSIFKNHKKTKNEKTQFF